MIHIKRYFTLVLVGLLQPSAVAAYGQAVIRGTVVDERQEPVIGATVVQKGTTNGVSTGMDGTFEFKAKQALPVTLLVHLIGYREQEVDVYDTSVPVSVTLPESVHFLDEVVVTGYVQQKRGVVTASIFGVNPKR